MKFEDLYNAQVENQQTLLDKGMYDEADSLVVPLDDVKLSSYHIQQLMSEVGEVLEADKRWKNFRNSKYDKEEKKNELADCFIVLMNIAMFSGITATEMSEAIATKIEVVSERIEAE